MYQDKKEKFLSLVEHVLGYPHVSQHRTHLYTQGKTHASSTPVQILELL